MPEAPWDTTKRCINKKLQQNFINWASGKCLEKSNCSEITATIIVCWLLQVKNQKIINTYWLLKAVHPTPSCVIKENFYPKLSLFLGEHPMLHITFPKQGECFSGAFCESLTLCKDAWMNPGFVASPQKGGDDLYIPPDWVTF